MSKIVKFTALAAAMSLLLVAGGCSVPGPHSAPQARSGQVVAAAGPERLAAGQDGAIPDLPPDLRGKALLQLSLRFPPPLEAPQSPRGLQYIAWDKASSVYVTVEGEGIPTPVAASVSVPVRSQPATVSVPLFVDPGRNQLITASALGSSGTVLATIKGVVSTTAGKAATASVTYGSTPLARVVGALGALAPEASAGEISAVIDPILGRTRSGGVVTYAVHPLFIDSAAVAGAFLRAAGTKPAGQVVAQDITAQLGGQSPVSSSGSVAVRFVDPGGSPQLFPNSGSGTISYRPWDLNSDGTPDGTTLTRRDYCGPELYQGAVSDPLSSRRTLAGSGSTVAGTYSGIPPGDWWFSYGTVTTPSLRPWLAPPFSGGLAVTVLPGQQATADIVLRDVSTRKTGSAFEMQYFRWYRYDTAAGQRYRFEYLAEGDGRSVACSYTSYRSLAIYQASGSVLFDQTDLSGAYEFVSSATDSLYFYTARDVCSIVVSQP